MSSEIGDIYNDESVVVAEADLAEPFSMIECRAGVFISSTFQDMESERQHLAEVVFPQLRKVFEPKGLFITELDLRWGITRQEAESGQVLDLCLNAIQDCRPFFVSMIGERYGWRMPRSREVLARLAPELERYSDRSVTELEIRFGMLESQSPARGIFLLRNPMMSRKSTDESEVDQADLRNLKDHIRRSNFPVIENYSSIEIFGEEVFRFLHDEFELLLNQASETGREQQQGPKQDNLLRAIGRNTIPRPKYLSQLDEYLKSGRTPLVLAGESGIGKSTILSNWIESKPDRRLVSNAGVLGRFKLALLKNVDPGRLVFRFCNDGDRVESWNSALWHLVNQIAANDEPIAPNPEYAVDALVRRFQELLKVRSVLEPLVIIVDGLDDAFSANQALYLGWIPDRLPRAVRIIVSLSDGDMVQKLRARNWSICEIEPFTVEEQVKMAHCLLASFGRKIGEDFEQSMFGVPESRTPLFTKLLLEELRKFTTFDNLDQELKGFLAESDVSSLIARVLEDCLDRIGEAREALFLVLAVLAASRRGLYEKELLSLLDSQGMSFSLKRWRELLLKIDTLVVSAGGLIRLSHSQVNRSLQNVFTERIRDARAILINFFNNKLTTAHAAEECVYQAMQLDEPSTLVEILGQMESIAMLWPHDEMLVKSAWKQLYDHGRDPSDFYKSDELMLEENIDALAAVSSFMMDIGDYDKAEVAISRRLELAESLTFRERCGVLGDLAQVRINQNRFEAALEILDGLFGQAMNAGENRILARTTGQMAVAHGLAGDYESGVAMHLQELEAYKSLQDGLAVSIVMGNLAAMYFNSGNLDQCERCLKEQEQYARRWQDWRVLQACLGNLGLLSKAKRDYSKALAYHSEELKLCESLNDRLGHHESLGNQALVHMDMGDFDKALELLDLQLMAARAIEDQVGTVGCLINQAVLFLRLHQFSAADQMLTQAERLAEQIRLPAILSERLVETRQDILTGI